MSHQLEPDCEIDANNEDVAQDFVVEPSAPPEYEEYETLDNTHSPSGEMTEEERQLHLEEYERNVMEHIPSLKEEYLLGEMADFCRISHTANPKFQPKGDKQREMQQQLLRFCKEACDAYDVNGLFNQEQAQAVAYAFITAANNNLYPTEESEAFFGVEVPGSLAELLKGSSLLNPDTRLDTDERKAFEEQTFGLLVWRTWKILIRTREGRTVLLGELLSQCDNETERKDLLNSYSAVEAVLVECLVTDTVRSKFIEWVKALPVSNILQNKCLNPREQKFLLGHLEDGIEPVEWLKSVKRDTWAN